VIFLFVDFDLSFGKVPAFSYISSSFPCILLYFCCGYISSVENVVEEETSSANGWPKVVENGVGMIETASRNDPRNDFFEALLQ